MAKAALTLQLDDGSAENNIGLSAGGQFMWFNRFTPSPADFPLQVGVIEVVFPGSANLPVGSPVEVLLYQDTDGDGDPTTNAELVGSTTGSVQAADWTTASTFTIDPSPVFEGAGDILVAVVNRGGTAGVLDYPAALDQTASQGRSWVALWSSGVVPEDPQLPSDAATATIDSLNFPGNWLIRAHIETNIPDTRPPVLLANTGLTVDEGATAPLTTAMLQAADPDTDDSLLLYAITTPPANGQLELTTGPGVEIASFTQAQLDAGQVVYVHDDSETTSDGFSFDVQDGSGNDLTGQAFAITVTAVDDLAPVLVVNAGISVAEGGSAAIDGSVLQASDPDTDVALLTYVVTSAPANGQLELASAPGIALASFDQAQLDAGQVLYLHDDSETTSDSFTFDVQDGSGNTLVGQVFAIAVTAVDDLPPVLAVNAGLAVAEGGTAFLGTSVLQATDPDTAAAQLVYSVTSAPAHGQLEFAGAAGVAIASFTQAQVDAGQVLYAHDDSNTASDAFTFSVEDAGGNVLSGQTFAITVSAVADDTVVVTPSALTLVEGAAGSFTVVLSTQPAGTVLIDLVASDTTVASVSPSQLSFSATTWSVPQTATVQTVDDSVAGGPRSTGIGVAVNAGSADPTYAALPPSSVAVTTLDNDAPGVFITPTSGLATTEDGGSDSFTVVLASQPTADVVITLASSDTTEGTVSPALLTFTAADWNLPQVVTVTGVNDGTQDEDQPWSVLIAAASADPAYDGISILAPGVVNGDDDEVLPIAQPAVIPTASHGVLAALALLLLALGGAGLRRTR